MDTYASKGLSLNFKWIPHGRALILVDIENLAGAGRVSVAAALNVAAAIDLFFPKSHSHHRLVGCDRGNAIAVGEAFPGARLLPGVGPDGAEIALLTAVEVLDVARRYTQVVIASGDGYFTEFAADAASLGLHVAVLTGYGGLSRRLRLAAHSHLQIEDALNLYGEAA